MADDEAKTEAAAPVQHPEAHKDEKTGALTDEKGHALMAVKVYAPFKVYYEGNVSSISAVNETGPFDILPHHRNFLCMLVPCDLLIKTPYEEKTVKISRALMHVKAEKVTVFLDV